MIQFGRSRFQLASIVVAGVLLLVSCGGGDGSNAKPALDSVPPPNLPVDTVPASTTTSGEGEDSNAKQALDSVPPPNLPVSTVPASTTTSGVGDGSNAKPALDSGPRPNLPVDAVSANGPLPPVTVRDLTQDRWVQFANFLPANKPVLVWFWAPH